jgi:hypothetical protein
VSFGCLKVPAFVVDLTESHVQVGGGPQDGLAVRLAVLRAEVGRNPYDRALSDLVGKLSTRSEEFRTRWAAHNVLFHRTGIKQLHHPVVGDLDLTYEALGLPSDPGLTLLVNTAEPDTPTQDALNLLASWAATLEQEQRAKSQAANDAP